MPHLKPDFVLETLKSAKPDEQSQRLLLQVLNEKYSKTSVLTMVYSNDVGLRSPFGKKNATTIEETHTA